MAIRTQRLSGSSEKRMSPDGWRLELERLERSVKQALVREDLEAFSGQLSVVDSWGDPHRSLQADMAVQEMLGEHRSKPRVWSRMYLAYGMHLLIQLKASPLEPERWNSLGVALYELGETRAADKCFRALEALYPDHPSLSHNKKAVKSRKRAGTPKRPFGPEVIAEAKQLAGRSEKLAATVEAPKASEQKLSLAMIVKDEEEMLEECLASVEGLVDEIIIVDTGSEDRTKEIAESFGAKVVDFAWTGDFSEARNVSLEHATGDWVMQLDADERLVAEDKDRLRALLSRVWLEGITLVETNYTGEDGSGAAVIHAPLRVWRNRPEYRFSGAIHEQKTDNMPVFLPLRFEASDLRLIHFGYLKEMVQGRGKSERNLKLLLAEMERSPSAFNYFNLGNEYALLGDAQNAFDYYAKSWLQLAQEGQLKKVGYGGMLAKGLARQARLSGSPEAARLCEDAMAVFPEHTDLFLERGYIFLSEGDPEGAESMARSALSMGEAPPQMCGAMGSGSFLARALLGEAYERQGRSQQAAEVYRESLSLNPEYLGSVGSLTRALLSDGRPVGEVAEEMTLLASGRSGALLLIAHALYEREEIAPAAEIYQQVLEGSPQNPVARIGLVECALSEGDLDKAIELCGEPSGVCEGALLRSLIFCLLIKEDFQGAEPLIARQALPPEEARAFSAWLSLASQGQESRLDPEAAVALMGMLQAALRLQAVEAAEVILVLAALSEMNTRARLQLSAESFLFTGYLESAAEAWLESIDTLGADADSLYGLAQISLSQQRPQEAMALAGDALELDPDHQLAARMISALSN